MTQHDIGARIEVEDAGTGSACGDEVRVEVGEVPAPDPAADEPRVVAVCPHTDAAQERACSDRGGEPLEPEPVVGGQRDEVGDGRLRLVAPTAVVTSEVPWELTDPDRRERMSALLAELEVRWEQA